MRDFVLFGAFLAVVPMILKHPYIGALAWVFHGLMNPQNLVWGFAARFPFGVALVGLTLAGMLLSKDARQLKGGAAAAVLFAFWLWTNLTTFFAVEPGQAWPYWERVMKIFFMTFILLALLQTKRHVELLVIVIVVSIGFYGVKGGVFTILTGGQHIIYGPGNSVIANNNGLAVALVMVMPLMVYLREQTQNPWIRLAIAAALLLCAASVLGSYSRGALLAIGAVGVFLWLKSKQKAAIFGLLLATLIVLVPFMPEHWEERMRTIQSYQEDASAMGRLIAWETAYKLAKDQFPVGGGFEFQSEATSARYSPHPDVVLVAHSIYFQVLGSQGFIGLAMFLAFWALVWFKCARIRSVTAGVAEHSWARTLASMTQVSLIGYFVGGAFLDLAFWDMPYYLFTAIAVTERLVAQRRASNQSAPMDDRVGIQTSSGVRA